MNEDVVKVEMADAMKKAWKLLNDSRCLK